VALDTALPNLTTPQAMQLRDEGGSRTSDISQTGGTACQQEADDRGHEKDAAPPAPLDQPDQT
jgi:hypothetical protein